jgi:hypothetical protein
VLYVSEVFLMAVLVLFPLGFYQVPSPPRVVILLLAQ